LARAGKDIYELTARLRRAVSPTRVSMKTKNHFRLYLLIQLTARLRRAVSPTKFKFKFKFKFNFPFHLNLTAISDHVRPYTKSTRAAAVGRFRRKVDRGRAPQG